MTTAAAHFKARTGLDLGPVALGTAALAGLYRQVDPDTASGALRTAWDLGVRSFDTAPHYGAGLAEQRLGRFLGDLPSDLRHQALVSTKVGRLLATADPATPGAGAAEFAGEDGTKVRVRDYSRAGVRRSIHDSLVRTGLDHISVALVHDPDEHVDQAETEAIPELVRMRDEGLIRAVGAGMNDAAALARLVAACDLDCVLLAGRWTLLDRTAEHTLLPLCERRQVAVLAGGVFNSGILADPRPGAAFDYTPAPGPVLEAALRMRDLCQDVGLPLTAAALQHPYRHPAVATVVVGARSSGEVRANLHDLALPVTAELWERLDALAVRR